MLKTFRNGWAKLAAGLAALALASCATQAQDAAPAGATRPAMWTLSDEDTTIYLFGTIHTLPEGVEWRTPALDRALGSADELVLEIAIDGNEMAAAAAMMRLGMGADLPALTERVPEARREELREAIAQSSLPAALFDRLETWAAALALMAASFERAGLDPELGVERQLIRAFASKRRRPQIGLETAEEQLGFFDRLPEEEQRKFLLGVLESPEEIRREFDLMLAAWRSGDTDAIARTFDDEAKISADLREQLLTRRNARWAEWLQRRLERPGVSFVAVGAGHLAGRDSVQEMLRERGLTTERVQ